MKTDQELVQAGLTTSGLKRYTDAVLDFEKTLLEKAIVFAQADKADDSNIEVTHDHVRSGAMAMAASLGKSKSSAWSVPVQIGEYIFTALAGIGGGSLKEPWGTPLFVLSVAIAVILFVVRSTRLKQP